MAGMGDNPLVGDYTKGISKGREYFVALQRRINAEKADPKTVASDLQMGLLKAINATREASIRGTGLGRFGPKTMSESNDSLTRSKKNPMSENHASLTRSKTIPALAKTQKVASLQDLKLLFK